MSTKDVFNFWKKKDLEVQQNEKNRVKIKAKDNSSISTKNEQTPPSTTISHSAKPKVSELMKRFNSQIVIQPPAKQTIKPQPSINKAKEPSYQVTIKEEKPFPNTPEPSTTTHNESNIEADTLNNGSELVQGEDLRVEQAQDEPLEEAISNKGSNTVDEVQHIHQNSEVETEEDHKRNDLDLGRSEQSEEGFTNMEDKDEGGEKSSCQIPSIIMMFDFKAQSNDELDAPEGTVLELIESNEEGWSVARLGDKVGFVPTDYFELYEP